MKRDRSEAANDGGNRRPSQRRRRGPGAWAVLAAVSIAASSAAGTMVLRAGTALAPEPVVTTQTLSGTNGATGDAVYQNSGTPTQVVKWYNQYVYAPNLPAGMPCSLSALPADAVTYYVIIAYGNYKECN